MNKMQRLAAALAGAEVDYVPSGFWLHFDEDKWFGKPAIDAHLGFYEQTDVDLLKIMNEYRYRMPEPVARIEDWARWKPLSVRGGYYQGQLDLIKAISDRIGGAVPLLATIHGVYICAFHGSRRPECTFDHPHLLTEHLRADPVAVAPALEAVADALIELSLASIEAGASGIYYSSIGGEKWRFDAETFETHLKPHETRVLDAIKATGAPLILHVCKSDARLSSYADYPFDAVNWAVHESDHDLAAGRRLFGRPLLGGLDDRSGVLVEGSRRDIVAEVARIVAEAGRNGFILGADCTLPTEISTARIRTAVEAVRSL
jgi:uroporphyrinogen decarboxylase